MLLSSLPFASEYDLEIYNEQEFETLALVAQNPGKKYITFIKEAKYFSKLNENASMVITKKELKDSVPKHCGIVLSETPDMTFFRLQNALAGNKEYIRPEYKTAIGRNCKIGKFASIAENNVTIGDNVIIEDFVTIYPNTSIKDNVIIRSGAKIGGQGGEYKRLPDNTVLMVEHCGGVILDHDVDIHCNVCIDRAVYPWDDTVVGEYTKIENLSHIAHAVKLGKRLIISANATVGGRTVVGDDSWIGLGAVIKNGITLGERVSVNMGSVLVNDLESEMSVCGNFAIDKNLFFYNQLKMSRASV